MNHQQKSERQLQASGVSGLASQPGAGRRLTLTRSLHIINPGHVTVAIGQRCHASQQAGRHRDVTELRFVLHLGGISVMLQYCDRLHVIIRHQ